MNKFLIHIILINFLFFSKTNLKAQSIVSKSFVKDYSISLRYLPVNMNTWEEAKNKGFKIERAELETADTNGINRIGFKLVFKTIAKLIDKQDSVWRRIITTKDYGAFLYNGLYKIPPAKNETDKIMHKQLWAMIMKQADLDCDAAKLLGLYYKDTTINKNKFYVYKISVNQPINKSDAFCYIFVNPKTDTYLPQINFSNYTLADKNIKLSFEAKSHESVYGSYIVERSEDSINFVPVSKKPYIFMFNNDEKNKTQITAEDTLKNNSTYYYYRLKGLSYFGVYGPFSKIIKLKGKEPIGSYPYMDSIILVKKETQIKVHFHLPEDANKSIIKGFMITRSEQSGKKGDLLSAQLLPKTCTSFLDENPKQTNYYKVLAITYDNDTVPSFEGFGMLPDRDPPSIPTDIKGFIDSTGIVHLSWKSNPEQDLQGYRIFRKNAIDEELIERSRRIVTQNLYIDTVDLKTLSKYIYYSLTAVDKVFNNSKYSVSIKLKKPDVIKPVAPVFTKVEHSNNAVILKWNNSTSDDVESYELYRTNYKTKQTIKLKQWFLCDTLAAYIDTTAQLGETYQYKLIVYDDSKNQAEVQSLFITFETGLRKPITDIKTNIDLEKRIIELTWIYPEKDIFSFIIYKAKQDDEFRIHKTISPTETKISDMQIYPGNIYRYRIKAIYKSGAESELSKEIKIEF